MSSLGHDAELLDDLLQLHQTSPSNDDLLAARSALMWLCVARKPLRAHELWIALQIEESQDVEQVERLVTQREHVDEERAATSLKQLLGSLITTREEGDDEGREIYISFCKAEMPNFLVNRREDIPSILAFTLEQGHILAASVCMITCSAAGIHLAHIHDESTASSLVLYAWTYWSTHFQLSGFALGNANAATLFDSMVYCVCVDALVFLIMLRDFVTGPITFPGRCTRLPAVASVLRAQRSLERPLGLLAGMLRRRDYAERFQRAREVIDASGYSGEGILRAPRAYRSTEAGSRSSQDDGPLDMVPQTTDAKDTGSAGITTERDDYTSVENTRDILPPGSSITSQIERLQLDKTLRITTPLLPADEREMLLAFADIARSLRLVSVSFVRTAIYEELLGEFAEPWSPVDVLYHMSNWFEAAARYPYWDTIREDGKKTPYRITDRQDDNYDEAGSVLDLVRTGNTSFRKHGDVSYHCSWARPPGISTSRWCLAIALYEVESWSRLKQPYPFVVNQVRPLSRQETSFAKLPTQMHSSSIQIAQIRHMDPLIPPSIRRFYRRHIEPSYNRLLASKFFKSLDDFSSAAFTAGMSQLWPQAKASILRHGYRRAFGYFGVAILTHHIRRMLAPWLGLYMYHTPLADVKMALGSPSVFLDEALSYTWRFALFMAAQKWVTDMFGAVTIRILGLDAESSENWGSAQSRAPSPPLGPGPDGNPIVTISAPVNLPKPLMDVARVGYLVWTLASAEYMFARSANTAAFLIAYTKLVFLGGDAEHIALGRVLQRHWANVPLHVWQVVYYISNGLYPILSGALASALRGQASLLLVIVGVSGGLAFVTRYSNKLYIVLELSGLVLVLGLCVVAAMVLGKEFIGDPLDLKKSAIRLQGLGAVARRTLPQGAAKRLGILRRRRGGSPGLSTSGLGHGGRDGRHEEHGRAQEQDGGRRDGGSRGTGRRRDSEWAEGVRRRATRGERG
jgi:hypothetical protein